jgi:hypothetical protein
MFGKTTCLFRIVRKGIPLIYTKKILRILTAVGWSSEPRRPVWLAASGLPCRVYHAAATFVAKGSRFMELEKCWAQPVFDLSVLHGLVVWHGHVRGVMTCEPYG